MSSKRHRKKLRRMHRARENHPLLHVHGRQPCPHVPDGALYVCQPCGTARAEFVRRALDWGVPRSSLGLLGPIEPGPNVLFIIDEASSLKFEWPARLVPRSLPRPFLFKITETDE